jgi:hypothetical protein
VTPNPYLNMRFKTKLRFDTLRVYGSARRRLPFAIHPDPEGLVVWGGTDNGDALCWKTAGQLGIVVVNEGSLHEWEDTRMSVAQFLVRTFDRSYACRLFPDDFPSDSPKFVAWKEQPPAFS